MLKKIGCDLFLPEQKPSPARIVLFYAFAGIGWILLSDNASAWFVRDLNQFENVAILKGVFFIIVTAGLLYLLIRHNAQQLRSSHQSLFYLFKAFVG